MTIVHHQYTIVHLSCTIVVQYTNIECVLWLLAGPYTTSFGCNGVAS